MKILNSLVKKSCIKYFKVNFFSVKVNGNNVNNNSILPVSFEKTHGAIEKNKKMYLKIIFLPTEVKKIL